MADMDSAREAIYDAIEEAAKQLKEDSSSNAYAAAPALRELAWAWRAVAGGAQPGVSVVGK